MARNSRMQTVGRTLEEMLKTLPVLQRAAVDLCAEERIAAELSLGELRKALRFTQSDVGKR
jgi:hypothetical protein